MSFSEQVLRKEACTWLTAHFPNRRYYLKPLVFHNMGMTLSQFLRKKFWGSELSSIPYYKELPIRPDIIALMYTKTNSNDLLAWVIGECKVDGISTGELGQAVRYANVSKAYEAYLFYYGELSNETTDAVKVGGHVYNGANRWGKITRKRVLLVKYRDQRFARIEF